MTTIIENLNSKFCKYVESKAIFYRNKLNFANEDSSHNNLTDAFKHVFSSVKLTLWLTWPISRYLTNEHEWKNLEDKAPVEESIMDFHNNRIGRKLALKALCWIFTFRYLEEKVAKEIVNNFDNMILSLEDTKISYYKDHLEELFERKCDLEKFKTYLNDKS